MGAKLDRSKWHSPLISVVITHYNYSDHVEEALLSILDQSYQNWECVIVDDASTKEHRRRLLEIVTRLACPKVRIIENQENKGQIDSFYVGVDNCRADFVALLDPDDRYAETFLKETVDAHLDDTFFCPLVCTDQYTLTAHGITTGTQVWHRRVQLKSANPETLVKDETAAPIERIFLSPQSVGWCWSSTSAMVFRKSALKYLRPHRLLAYRRAADAYLATGAHIIGGTLFLAKPLVYRRLHSRNSWITEDLFSMDQSKQRPGVEHWAATCRRDVVEAMLHNGVREVFDAGYLTSVLKSHFSEDDLALLRAVSSHVAELVPTEPMPSHVSEALATAAPVAEAGSTAIEVLRPKEGPGRYLTKSYWNNRGNRLAKSIRRRLSNRSNAIPKSS
jgi:hypothetical protein